MTDPRDVFDLAEHYPVYAALEAAEKALREAAQWLAATGYPTDWRTDVRTPDALWEALVDVVHEGDDWRELTREEVADWLAEEAGRIARGGAAQARDRHGYRRQPNRQKGGRR